MSSADKDAKGFTFNSKDFERVRKILLEKAGINLADSKDSMVYSRLARRLRALNLNSFDQYLDYLAKNSSEDQHFVNALTTNLTSFFREYHHFPILKEFLLQQRGNLRIWCAAASTGEEPYSIAMTVAEAYGKFDVPVQIIASDIDSSVLQTAKAGIYPVERIKSLTDEQRITFFRRGKGANQGKAKVVPELAKMIQYQQINLMHNNWQLDNPIDIIFCRNVMIYFDKDTQVKILSRMVQLMSANSLYFAGHSENFSTAEHLVKSLGKTVYQPVKVKRQ